MQFERTSVAKFEDIERLIKAGQSDRKIAKSLRCRRTLAASIRNKLINQAQIAHALSDADKSPPLWAAEIDWDAVEKDILKGHQIKRIWEEVADGKTSSSNFFKYTKARFKSLLKGTVTLREFKAGEYAEVDYAGDKIPWVDLSTGEVMQAHVFIGILCFSQKIFAHAAENEKQNNWLNSHRRMFEFYGGSARVVVPDQLKNGVIKSHLYDPDLNPGYVDLASHYNIAVIPARVRRPKDKALVEGAVGIIMRYFKFVNRNRTFTSLKEVNVALVETVSRVNAKKHTRFRISRAERFESLEKSHLQALPLEPYAMCEWKTPKVHPDCTVELDKNFYTAPHIHRGKDIRAKLTATRIDLFLDLELIASHARVCGKFGERVVEPQHLPPNCRAYLEATPQMLLAQAKFSHPDLHSLVETLFQEDALGHLRRVQGLVRKAYQLIQKHGRETANPWMVNAIAQMCRFNKFRVQAFEEFLKTEMKRAAPDGADRTIERKPGNPMVRGLGVPLPEETNNNGPQLRLV